MPTVSVPPGSNYGLGLRLGTRLADGSCLVAIDVDRDEFVRLARALVPSPCGRIGQKGIALFARVAEEQAAGFDLKLAPGAKPASFSADPRTASSRPPSTPTPTNPIAGPTSRCSSWTRWSCRSSTGIFAAVFASEHLPELMGGVGTHDATFKFIGELANLSDDYDYIERVIRACFPEDYNGDSLSELPRMLRDTARKFESGQWTKAGATSAGAPPFSEEHLALEFADRYCGEFRYANGMGWL